MNQLFGYPLRLAAYIDGEWVDVSEALTVTAVPEVSVGVSTEKYLDAIDKYQRTTLPAVNWRSLQTPLPPAKPLTGGLRPVCDACGAMSLADTCTAPGDGRLPLPGCTQRRLG